MGRSEILQRTLSAEKALKLRREFANRQELADYLRAEFPGAAERDNEVSEWRGGRAAAEAKLCAIRPDRYAGTRNYLDGLVSYLSPYIRHGVLSLAEVRTHALTLAPASKIYKFIQELAWRDYWQRLYEAWGDGIWQDREEYKTGFDAADYAEDLPGDVSDAQTGLACMDAFATELHTTGYLHNHARMWVAAYVVHWRRVRWQAGARWFLRHLLDGDPASNNLSWQWVASTFSHKTYLFNRENLEKYTRGVYCETCGRRGDCPFDASYAELSSRLFRIEGGA